MKSSPYASTIAAATGAPEREWAVIEQIMRTEVFHSTLDWQTRSELGDGARKAHRILKSNRPFYELSQQQAQILFKEMQVRQQIEKAEASLSRAEARGDSARAETAKQRLQKSTQRLRELNHQIQILSGLLDRLCGHVHTLPGNSAVFSS